MSDLPASRAFYHEALGLPTVEGEWIEWGDFGVIATDEEHPVTRRLHVAFGTESRDDVDAWWNRMTEAGYESDGEPGPRPQYSESYYGAFVPDRDGNSVESVHHDASRAGRSTTCGYAHETSRRPRGSTTRLLRSSGSASRTTRRIAFISRTVSARSHSSQVMSRRKTCTSRSECPTSRRSSSSITLRFPPATGTTACPGNRRSTTPATTGHSSSTRIVRCKH